MEKKWMLNRPALCCTWSCGSCERPCRVSSLDTAVPDTQKKKNAVSFPFSWKRRVTVAFPAAFDHLTPNLFPCCFHVLIQLPLWDHSPDTRHTHTLDCRDMRNRSFMACGVCYSWWSQILFIAKPQSFFPSTETPFFLSISHSSPINPLHSPAHSPLLLFPPNLFNTPLLFPPSKPVPFISSHPASALHPPPASPSSFVPPFLSLLPALFLVIYLKWP